MIIAFLIALTAVSAPVSANAAGTVSLTVTSITAIAGEDIVISINISENSRLAAATFLLKYDTTKLTYKSSAAGSAAADGFSSINPNFAVNGNFKTINDSFISSDEVAAAGSMLNVTFTVNTGWTGSTPLTLTTSDFANGHYIEIPKTITNGSVTVNPQDAPVLSATPITPTNGNVTVTITYPEEATVKEYKISTGDWKAYTDVIVLSANDTIYARFTDGVGHISETSLIIVSNIDKDAPATPILASTPTAPIKGNVTVTINYPTDADVKECKIGTGDWEGYSAEIVLSSNNTVYARCSDAAGNYSDTGSIIVSNIEWFVNIKENDSNDDGVIYRIVKLFGFYRNESLELGFETNLSSGAQVKWESSNVRKVVIGETSGIITNKGMFARAADITVTLTEGSTVVTDTVRVIFYKFGWQLNNLT